MESFNNSFLTRFIQDSLPLPQEAIFTVVNLEELNTFLQEGAIKRPLSLMSLLEVTLKKTGGSNNSLFFAPAIVRKY